MYVGKDAINFEQQCAYQLQRVLHKIRPTCFQSSLSTLCSMTSIGYRLFLMRLTENKMRQMVDTGFKCFVCQIVAGIFMQSD